MRLETNGATVGKVQGLWFSSEIHAALDAVTEDDAQNMQSPYIRQHSSMVVKANSSQSGALAGRI